MAHELDHNLGLTHCGDKDADDPDDPIAPSCTFVGAFPPNVASIMRYVYQLLGVRSHLMCEGSSTAKAALFKEIDYSHGMMCDLNEGPLDERFGARITGVRNGREAKTKIASAKSRCVGGAARRRAAPFRWRSVSPISPPPNPG